MKLWPLNFSATPNSTLSDEAILPLSSQGWHRAKVGGRAFSSSNDLVRLLCEGMWVADSLIVLLAALVAYVLRHGSGAIPVEIILTTLLALVITVNVLHFSGAYATAPEDGFATQMGKVLKAWTLAFIVLMLIGYLTKTSDTYSRFWVASWYGLTLCGFAALRAWSIAQTRRWGSRGWLARTVAIVELGGGGKDLLKRLQSARGDQFHLVGLFSGDEAPLADSSVPGNRVEDLISLSRSFRIDEVLVVATGAEVAGLPGVLRKLGTIPTNVRFCPWTGELGSPVREVGLVMQSPALTIHRKPMQGWSRVVKRAEDIVLTSVAIALLSPLLLAVAVLVKCDSKGPVLFRQPRLGFNNNVFTVLKFRTMKHQRPPEVGVPQAQRRDPRITRVGGVLRRLSLDELPQLFNVLKGDMSLVGPRPHALAHNDQYAVLIDDYLGRHRVLPGITGWAQVKGFRGETDTLDKMQRRVECDLAYIDDWSILLDLRIMLLTVLSLMFDRNAY